MAQFRLRAVNHHKRYGLSSTLDAFNVKQSTFYDWRKAYLAENEKTSALVPKSTAPEHVRKMETDSRLVEFIKQMRTGHGNIGSHVIKPFLDQYALEIEVKTIGLTNNWQGN